MLKNYHMKCLNKKCLEMKEEKTLFGAITHTFSQMECSTFQSNLTIYNKDCLFHTKSIIFFTEKLII